MLQSQIRELDKEYARGAKATEALGHVAEDKGARLKNLAAEVRRLEKESQARDKRSERLAQDFECAMEVGHSLPHTRKAAARVMLALTRPVQVRDPTRWKAAIVSVFEDHIKGGRWAAKDRGGTDAGTVAEFNRQRQLMERALTAAQRKQKRDASQYRHTTQQRVSENVALLDEVNSLRKERKEVMHTVDVLAAEVRGPVCCCRVRDGDRSGTPPTPACGGAGGGPEAKATVQGAGKAAAAAATCRSRACGSGTDEHARVEPRRRSLRQRRRGGGGTAAG